MDKAIRRIFVEKREGFNVEAQHLRDDLRDNLGISGLESLRIVNRYDVAGISDEEYARVRGTIFSEPNVDLVYDERLETDPAHRLFAMEYLPGQYDQRADWAAQCIQIVTQKERPVVQSAKVIVLEGQISDDEFNRIKAYCINPVESREASLEKPASLDMQLQPPEDVKTLDGFIAANDEELRSLMRQLSLAMSFEDVRFCQAYFRDEEQRDPTITEIRVIDTYWSDHCRHTTFFTKIEDVQIEEGAFTGPIRAAYEEYLQSRNLVYGDKERDVCLMDMAVIAMKEMKKQGHLDDLDESDEINACSIVVQADVDGKKEDWLVMFKNETHNHPTEIEPFGGAATCLGGAIRDPLSGRSYVYQAMRVTGSGDPRTPVENTLPGKLPQRKITIGAAAGYSSYGNQIGLATGQVAEIYDEGFVAKRMEIGAVIGAVPRQNVVRKAPAPGDVILLVGGRTGRDGCGGATGSSKEHTAESLFTCGAEVQKGNPVTERKIQRLFRHPDVSRRIKKCNDFGAGGVSVAIGELTDGLIVNLDAIPKKYEGLDGTELAIAESQERMAVVVAPEDVDAFIRLAHEENLEVTPVASVTAEKRLKMNWRGATIVNLSRQFLNTNGVKQRTTVTVKGPEAEKNYFKTLPAAVEGQLPDLRAAWLANLSDLNVCSQKGLVDRFDSTIGANTVLMPFGGVHQASPAQGMVAKLPVLGGETTTATAMTFGYNPQLAKWSPFHGALYAVIESVAKAVALGGDYRRIRLTLQEYFEKLGKDPVRWGKPFSALLGAFVAQKRLGIAAIGGKDSMSGTFMDLHVPPTLVSFAVNVMDASQAISSEFKGTGHPVVLLPLRRDENELPDFASLDRNYRKVAELVGEGKVLAAYAVGFGGVAAAVSKMAFGNRIGLIMGDGFAPADLFRTDYGSLVLEIDSAADLAVSFGDVPYVLLGYTQEAPILRVNGVEIALTEAQSAWEKPLEKIFPTRVKTSDDLMVSLKNRHSDRVVNANRLFTNRNSDRPAVKIARPRVFIPVFPGTNCEYDTARAFEKAGAVADLLIVRNLTPRDVEESITEMVKGINNAQIVALPGGFSAGDEPEGSGKFIAAMFRNPRVKEAVANLLKRRDGLMLGICNGFQALIKLGLVPYGEIVDITEDSPTLTYNRIGRHISCMARTKVVSTLSPWFSSVKAGEVHSVALSHGEGRFFASPEMVERLLANGQIATQYVDLDGNISEDIRYNPNGSVAAVEGITSPDGRILGKMGHSERIGRFVAVNVPGEKDQRIFASGVAYFQ
ncbi:phosphoribosylformylglycinamidine (fgam) synthase, purl component [Heliomicrobium modesticaldum Ice1]|uniref:Phosphoribosylformylglycinamidine (Fgam) synthase, purl component n=1 Tax=Heliobacterium modesticaldum (strain ATCC 51547 / Ice1) TaxID=498761 RepID=B0TBD5_HELMI|nr:phosphoribosylformylglycinamidine synthase [Heliomicrobium modesticaldum]ABZ85148.1 phosphoribosylformylglycinamidine (fgam) synthase, purl component [Heliomicrobium modesticaldum Ice1]